MMLYDRQVQHSTIISHLEIEMEVSLQVMRCDRLLICDTMIAVHYGHLSHLLQTLGLGAVLVSARVTWPHAAWWDIETN